MGNLQEARPDEVREEGMAAGRRRLSTVKSPEAGERFGANLFAGGSSCRSFARETCSRCLDQGFNVPSTGSLLSPFPRPYGRGSRRFSRLTEREPSCSCRVAMGT